MNKSLAVFLCSTHTDLKEERAHVLQAAQNLKLQRLNMELFGARANLPIETCLEEVRKSDLVVIVIGHLYGSLVPRTNYSFTEAEYREAVRLGKPCLIYFKSDEVPVLPRFVERDPMRAAALDRFKKRLQTKHTVAVFSSAAELSERVASDLKLVRENSSESKKVETKLQQWVDEQKGANDAVKRFVKRMKLSVDDHGILRTYTTEEFYVAPSRSFLVNIDHDDETTSLILFTYSDALLKGLARDDKRLIAGLLSRLPMMDAATRVSREMEEEEKKSQWIKELHEANDPFAEALPQLYVQRLNSGDTTVIFPEDDFLDENLFHDPEQFDQAMITSKLKEICPYIRAVRSGLPKSTVEKLLKVFN